MSSCRSTAAVELFGLATEHAEKQGLALSVETVSLTPSKALAQAIDFSLTKAVRASEDD